MFEGDVKSRNNGRSKIPVVQKKRLVKVSGRFSHKVKSSGITVSIADHPLTRLFSPMSGEHSNLLGKWPRLTLEILVVSFLNYVDGPSGYWLALRMTTQFPYYHTSFNVEYRPLDE